MQKNRLHRTILVIVSLLLATGAEAAPFSIPDANPQNFNAINSAVDSIKNDLEQAMCGGWDFDIPINGVYFDPKGAQSVCPPSAGQNFGGACRTADNKVWRKTGNDKWETAGVPGTKTDADIDAQAMQTVPAQGLIPLVKNLPGRDIDKVFWNVQSGLAKRNDEGELADIHSGDATGFTYPNNPETTGFTTVCRPPNYPDNRTTPTDGQNHGPRDLPGFFCEHPCQRPLDGPPPQFKDDPNGKGKPKGWDPEDSSAVSCGAQQPYEPQEEQIKYSCGGLEMKGPGDNFTQELLNNGPKGGLCQDLNSWTYVLWKKVVHVCYEKAIDPVTAKMTCTPVPIYRYEKGPCGFPEELDSLAQNQTLCKDKYTAEIVNECCSDDTYGNPSVTTTTSTDSTGNTTVDSCSISLTYDMERIGTSCKTCQGDTCRIYPNKNDVIVNDVWFQDAAGRFITDLNGRCLVNPSECEVVISDTEAVNHGAWNNPPDAGAFKKKTEDREYISYFRDYNEASYERANLLTEHVPDDIFKMEKIPVACYGMYDYRKHSEMLLPDPKKDAEVPENAKITKVRAEDFRCVIGAYYPSVNFAEGNLDRKEKQKGKAQYLMNVNDDPFADGIRPYDNAKSIWKPDLGDAFSLLNAENYEKQFGDAKDLTYALLSPDVARQRATVQVDKDRPLDPGALVRAFDDTVTYEEDPTRDRRTIVEWWQRSETEMHSAMTPPTVRMIIPSTWSVDLDALDPLFIAPPVPSPADMETDPRSQTVEAQVQAREDLLGDVAAFLERAMLLRVEEVHIPLLVPTGSPTELRAIAQGWESWAKHCEIVPPSAQARPCASGVANARDIRDKILEYADLIERVRVLRAQLPRYVATLLNEQKKVSENIADWLRQNTDAYKDKVAVAQKIAVFKQKWQSIQGIYAVFHDSDNLPWCRNDRFTAPIYSLLDPWLPGRDKEGDMTAGMRPWLGCMRSAKDMDLCTDTGFSMEDCANFVAPGLQTCLESGLTYSECSLMLPGCDTAATDPLRNYLACVLFVGSQRTETPASFNGRVCDQFIPPPPLLPAPEFEKEPDLELDFSAFRELQEPIKIPVLKPVEIRIKLSEIEPPGLEQDTEPSPWPELPPLPDLPISIAEDVIDSLPVIDETLRKPAALSKANGANPFPAIPLPTIDVLKVEQFLIDANQLILDMTRDYRKFWNSIYKKPCGAGGGSDCVKPGTEQDCILPWDDPNGKCVHFEADLKERLQRIGARPGIFLKEDLDSQGQFRNPIVHGQRYCEKEDWACQLLNAYGRNEREGWLLDAGESEDQQDSIDTLRKDMREATQNTSSSNGFIYDMPREELLENFRIAPDVPIQKKIVPVSL